MKHPVYCLLIDDDAEDKEFFNQALRHVDPEILLHYSASGEDALQNLESGNYKPNYIFLDLNMQPMNGMESLLAIKKIPGCVDTPVIIYSNTINEEMKYKTLSMGAFDHFEKPPGLGELETYLRRLLQIK